MNEGRVPSPGFDTTRYERPNKHWVCGYATKGCPCRVGPSPSGQCRATTECVPELQSRPNEPKGTWKCTRPKVAGGPCVAGPRPDGTCCRVIPKCQPVRSLRGRRGLVARVAFMSAVGLMLLGFFGSFREAFVNPGLLAAQHSGANFARLAEGHGEGRGCVLCHAEAHANLADLAASATRAAVSSLPLAAFVTSAPRDFSRMDQACAECHRAHSFHQANVPRPGSCADCHAEHRGPEGLMPVADRHCTACHGDSNQMAAAARKGRELASDVFARPSAPGIVTHAPGRPADGYTRTIHGFAADHPEFRVRQPDAADTNSLKFNHHVHLTGPNIPPVNGKPLDCAYCHLPDASGAYMQRVTFEKNCRSCHALNFDENNPGMTLPHGDPALVRAYLGSLPTNYADYATRSLGLVRREEIQGFVEEQVRSLRARRSSGENLEQAVFFADLSTRDAPAVAGGKGPAHAKFSGCVTCHEVTPRGSGVPSIAPPQTPERWMMHARFNHKPHVTMKCTACHAASQSRRTSDIIMPAQKSCVECHGPKGSARSDCSACHSYHNEPPSASTALSPPPPVHGTPPP